MSLRYDAAKTLLRLTLPPDLFEALMLVRHRRRERDRHRLTQSANRLQIARLLAGSDPIRLDLGAASKRDGWTTIDSNGYCDLSLDLTEPLPFPSNSVALIYASHFLEHLSYPSPLTELLAECHRVLKPGGTLSVAVPDAGLFMKAYSQRDLARKSELCPYDVKLGFLSHIDYLNYVAYMGGQHRHMFDADSLPLILREAGFTDAILREFDETLDMPSRRFESLYAHGTK
jgi:predicted SAM-dependent methyltransferase